MAYSQNLEETYILDYFKDTEKGTFLSVGENNGETFSNVRALALTGRFSGVMVEPSPKAFEKLKNLYNSQKGFYVYPFAISDKNEKKMLNESGPLCTPSDIGLVSTFHSSEMDRFKRTVSYNPVEVQAYRWKTFYNRLTIKTFNFVSIDAEGSDLTILEQMDLDALKVQCICIEWNGNEMLKHQYEQSLNGFKLIYTSGENLIYGR